MDIIEAMEIKIFNFVKDWIETKERRDGSGGRLTVKTVNLVPFSNIIVINKATRFEAHRTYKSLPDPYFQKMLKTHKDYYTEAFKQEQMQIRKNGYTIDGSFLYQHMSAN